MKCDILISGVGGQGTVLASRLLAASAIEMGYFARTSETIGMSQRGGCVVSHVRVDSENSSPIIPLKTADIIIGFELGEAARNLQRLAPKGRCIINTQTIMPVTASLGSASYDVKGISDYIKSAVPDSIFIDGYALAEKAGSVKAVNVVLIGAAVATGLMPMTKEVVQKVIFDTVPPKFAELNAKAFNIGYDFVK